MKIPQQIGLSSLADRSPLAILLFFLLLFIPLHSKALTLIDSKTDNFAGVNGLSGASSVAVTPEGNFLYATGFYENAIAVFKRDTATGTLGFVQSVTNANLMNGIGLKGANAIKVSQDSKHVYVASPTDNAVSVFTRNFVTGELTLAQVVQNNIGGIAGLAGASAIAFSPDNTRVYVTGTQDNSLLAFDRDTNTGFLTLLQVQKDGEANVDGLGGAIAVTVASDGMIYVAGSKDSAVAVFNRNPAIGEIGFIGVYKNGFNGITDMSGAYGLALSPDDKHLYVASNISSAVVALSRDAAGSLRQIASYKNREAGVNGLAGIRSLIVTPDGSQLYTVSVSDNAVSLFNRNKTTGELTFVEFQSNGTNNVTTLNGVTAITVSPDGKFIYTAALFSNAVTAFSLVSTDLVLSVKEVPLVAINSSLTYTVTVSNQGAYEATNVIVTDVLPKEVIFIESSPAGCTLDAASHTVSCVLNTIKVGESVVVTLKTTTPTEVGAGSLVNKATVKASEPEVNVVNNTVDTTTTLQASVPNADVAVEFSNLPTQANLNSTVTYRVTASNEGPEAASQVILTHHLPAEVVFVTVSDSRCTRAGTVLTCALGSVGKGLSVAIDITVTTPVVATSTPLNFKAEISATETDPSTGNNSATALLSVSQLTIDLAITEVTATPSSVSVGDVFSYQIGISNKGSTPASGGALKTKLLPQVRYLSSTGSTCIQDSTELSCPLGVLDAVSNPNTSISITVLALQPTQSVSQPATAISSEFSVTGNGLDSDNANNTAKASVTITGSVADFALTVEDNANPVMLNGLVTYTVTLVNNGPTTSSARLIGEVSGASAVVVNSCGGGGTSFYCDLGPLEAGGTQVVKVDVKPTTLGVIHFAVEATSLEEFFDPTTPNQVSRETSVSDSTADLELSLIATSSTANATTATDNTTGNTATTAAEVKTVLLNTAFSYTAKIMNKGPGDAMGVTFSQTLPTTVTFVSARSSQGEPCTEDKGQISCKLGTLNKSGEATVVVELIPKEVGKLSTSANVFSKVLDAAQENNTKAIDVEVSEAKLDLQMTLEDSPDPILLKDRLTYTATIKNAGPEAATQIQFVNTLPAEMTLLSTQISPKGSCFEGIFTQKSTSSTNSNSTSTSTTDSTSTDTAATTASTSSTSTSSNASTTSASNTDTFSPTPEVTALKGTVTCTIDSLLANSSVTIVLTAQPEKAGDFANKAIVSSREFDTNSADNSLEISTRVNLPASLYFIEVQKNGTQGVTGLKGVNDLAMSADGRHLYAAAFGDNALVVFNRTPTDGKLNLLQVLIDNSQGIDGLESASAVAVSPEGNFVYATGFKDNAVSVFARDTTKGTLTLVETYKDGIAGIDGLAGPFALIVTQQQVYVAGVNDDAIALFQRDTSSGKLTFVESYKHTPDAAQLDAVNSLAITPDGLHLIAGSANSKAVNVFGRDLASGRLSYVQTLVSGTQSVEGIDSVNGLVVSGDGRHVYVISGGKQNAVTVFTRTPGTGLLTFAQVIRDGNACGESLPQCTIDGLDGAFAAAISPLGDFLYVGGTNDSAVVVFRRDPGTGQLSFVDFLRDGADGIDGLGGLRALVTDPTGIHIYAAGFTDNGIAALRIASSDLKISIQDNPDPVNLGKSLVYTVAVTNQGPDRATDVTVIDTLPTGIKIVSVTPAQGNCGVERTIVTCALGTLTAQSTTTITLVVEATQIDQLVNTVNAISGQFDPISPNEIKESTQVIATSDLQLTLEAAPNPAITGNPLHYTIRVKNQGPDTATTITVTDQLPEQLTFVSATVVKRLNSAETDDCSYNPDTRTVTCQLASIPAQSTSDITLTVTPSIEGMITNTVLATSAAFDPNQPNQVSSTIEALLNIIDLPYDNTGKELANYVITTTGSVHDGRLSGTIVNQGLLSNVSILPNTTISGGGRLSGIISNQGTIDHAQLVSGTVINGGNLRGKITGFPSDPALINSHILSGTELNHVIIGAGSQLEAGVILGAGVRFTTNASIPAGTELTNSFNQLTDNTGICAAVDLSQDILIDSTTKTQIGSLLSSINSLPELSSNGLLATQSPTVGYILIRLGDDMAVACPTRVTQLSTTDYQPGITLFPDGSALIVTNTYRGITLQPSLQSPSGLKASLTDLGLSQFSLLEQGNIAIMANSEQYFVVRPHYLTTAKDDGKSGLIRETSPFIPNLPTYLLKFLDEQGVAREQLLYPGAAHSSELKTTLQGIPGATGLTLYGDGRIVVKVGVRTYTAVLDYAVKTGMQNRVTQFLMMPDQNGDGTQDVRMVYTNGDQQLIYIQPLPQVAEDIQAIPGVQAAGIRVMQNDDGNLVLTRQDGTTALLSIIGSHQIGIDNTPEMNVNPNGSIAFITVAGEFVTTQPLIQDFAMFSGALTAYGLDQVLLQEDGNMMIPYDDTLHFVARPNLSASSTQLPLGFQTIASSVPNVSNFMISFKDKAGKKWQQVIYPAAQDLNALYHFLLQLPSVISVVFHNDGSLWMQNGNMLFKGVFAYNVVAGEIPTGGIQFNETVDVNKDGISDYVVVYPNGDRQVVYRLN